VPRVAGVILDGYRVMFVDCNINFQITCRVEPEVGAYYLDADKIRRIVRAVIASYRKRLDAKALALDFGYVLTSGIMRWDSGTSQRSTR
jgi:hypothetical protein